MNEIFLPRDFLCLNSNIPNSHGGDKYLIFKKYESHWKINLRLAAYVIYYFILKNFIIGENSLSIMDSEAGKRVEEVHFHRRVHFANERTFLAWVRTSVAIMAFGFIIERFDIFLQQLAILGGIKKLPPTPSMDIPSILGIALVIVGAIIMLLAAYRFLMIKRQIEADVYYRPSVLLDILVAGLIISVAIFLAIYLAHILR
ncbi:MAG: DUF202 domain-containing protein [Euryarchaeota archaeon]|nr:DUF202 domain-containing protein [Euryarchaeota archaeon]